MDLSTLLVAMEKMQFCPDCSSIALGKLCLSLFAYSQGRFCYNCGRRLIGAGESSTSSSDAGRQSFNAAKVDRIEVEKARRTSLLNLQKSATLSFNGAENVKPAEPQSRLRLLVIGSKQTGKSSLVEQFVNGIFLREHNATVKDEFTKQLEVDGQRVTVDIVDIAGIEEYDRNSSLGLDQFDLDETIGECDGNTSALHYTLQRTRAYSSQRLRWFTASLAWTAT
jgi:hypothetical protein